MENTLTLRPLKEKSNLFLFEKMANLHKDQKMAKASFDEVYYRFYKYVWNTSIRICKKFSKDAMVAEELFQDIFEKIYFSAADLVKSNEKTDLADITIKAWIGRVGINKLMDYIRGNKVENEGVSFVNGLHDERDYQESDLVSDNSDFNPNLFRIEQEIEKLSDKEKEILYLYIYNTKTKVSTPDLKSIAGKHNVSVETIRKTYYRILEKLKNQLT